MFSPDRIDNAFIDRLLAKCTDHLSLLAAPAALERVYDFGADAFEAIFDSLRATVPCIVVDVPHQWTGWTKQTLVGADDILIVAAPDLANLRNTKNLYDRSRRRGRTTIVRCTASTRSGCRSGRKSRRPISPRRSTTSPSPSSRSNRNCSARRRTTAR
jgi:MinD-like ATPase involved in chromosome partitioning or flagellar assembly